MCKVEILERVNVNTRPVSGQQYRAQEATDHPLLEQSSCYKLDNKTHNDLGTS